jgi:copper chaperone
MISLNIQGMSCQHCVGSITRAITQKDPAAQVKIDLTTAHLEAQTVLDVATLSQLITALGFEVKAAG